LRLALKSACTFALVTHFTSSSAFHFSLAILFASSSAFFFAASLPLARPPVSSVGLVVVVTAHRTWIKSVGFPSNLGEAMRIQSMLLLLLPEDMIRNQGCYMKESVDGLTVTEGQS